MGILDYKQTLFLRLYTVYNYFQATDTIMASSQHPQYHFHVI